MILLNPGPANTTDAVKQALVCADICPREPEFGAVMAQVSRRLAEVVDPTGGHVAVLLAGSGTAAVEAALASSVPPDGRLLVIDNGAYGARLADIARAYGMSHDVEAYGVGDWLDPERIGARLATGRYTQLAVVHHETTTGMLNPVERLAAHCRTHGVELIVDAMSSYAGIPIEMGRLGADLLVSSSNKCIQGMAGLSFVIGKPDHFESLAPIAGRSLYLSLGEQYRYFARTQQMRFTPPVQVVYALAAALDELESEGGVPARHARYRACFEALDRGMRRLGFRRLLPEDQLSHILTAYLEPDHANYSFERMHDLLYAKGFTIYPGKGAKQATFRLANMGAITPDDMARFVEAMDATLGELEVGPLYVGSAKKWSASK